MDFETENEKNCQKMIIDSVQVKFVGILVFVLALHSSAVQSLSRTDCRCKIGVRRRIVGGHLATHYVPWQIALFYSGSYTCSGFIINEEFVATAQHCLTDRLLTNFKVVVGVVSLREIDSQLIFNVSKAIQHPEFSESKLVKGHDLAILQLSTRIKFKVGQIEPACMKPQALVVPHPDPIMVSGFGVTETIYVGVFLIQISI